MKFIEIPIYLGLGKVENVLININSIAYIKPYDNNDTIIILNTPHDGNTNNLTTSVAYAALRDKIRNA